MILEIRIVSIGEEPCLKSKRKRRLNHDWIKATSTSVTNLTINVSVTYAGAIVSPANTRRVPIINFDFFRSFHLGSLHLRPPSSINRCQGFHPWPAAGKSKLYFPFLLLREWNCTRFRNSQTRIFDFASSISKYLTKF